MRTLRGVTTQDIDRLLSGRMPAAGAAMDDLTSFFGDLDQAFPRPQIETLEARHVAAMMDAAAETAVAGSFVSASAEAQPSKTSRYISSIKRKVVAGSVAGLTAFSGMAVAGVLPPSVQRGVADAAGQVGIDLPGATADEASRAAERHPLERGSQEVAEPLEDEGRSDRRDGDAAKGSGDDPERRRDRGAAVANDDAEESDVARDREEDASDEAEDAGEEGADDGRDREEEAAGETLDHEEDAADEAEDAEEEDTDDGRDREEEAPDSPDGEDDATDEAPDADEEPADGGLGHDDDASDEARDAEGETELRD